MKSPVVALLALVPAVVIAAVVGAWWASSGPADETLRAELDALRQRVADLERQGEARTTAQRAAERHVGRLEERVVEAELREAGRAAAVAPAPRDSSDGSLPLRPEDVPAREAALKAAQEARKKAQSDQLRASLDTMKDTVQGLKSSLVGMQLRKLPVEERWKRAQKDVGLNENQVEVLRAALTDRDAVYTEATEREKRQDEDGTWVVETRVDTDAVAEADRRYATGVSGVMTDEQRLRYEDYKAPVSRLLHIAQRRQHNNIVHVTYAKMNFSYNLERSRLIGSCRDADKFSGPCAETFQ